LYWDSVLTSISVLLFTFALLSPSHWITVVCVVVDILWCILCVFRGAFAESRKAHTRFVSPSTLLPLHMYKHGFHWTDFH
jgi:hypothetical protein